MKNIFLILMLVAIVYGYQQFKAQEGPFAPQTTIESLESERLFSEETLTLSTNNQVFSCDGRTHCSQMTSCAEATYFIQHCPNTKMDGNNDGVPCEKQWCK
jgi:hypothetical protein